MLYEKFLNEAAASFDPGMYRSNIMEAVRYKGGQYIVPLDFGFEFISFNKNRVNEAAAGGRRVFYAGIRRHGGNDQGLYQQPVFILL